MAFLSSWWSRDRQGECSKGGKRARSTSHRRTNTSRTLTHTQGRRPNRRRNEEHLHGRRTSCMLWRFRHASTDTCWEETEISDGSIRVKCRCDRILWHGQGIEQLQYIRGESRFSDHRPVCSVFVIEADVDNGSMIRKGYSTLDSRIHFESPIPQRHSFYDDFWLVISGFVYTTILVA